MNYELRIKRYAPCLPAVRLRQAGAMLLIEPEGGNDE